MGYGDNVWRVVEYGGVWKRNPAAIICGATCGRMWDMWCVEIGPRGDNLWGHTWTPWSNSFHTHGV